MENKIVPYTAIRKIAGHKVLVLAPHPDDEVFGCGGAIIRHVEALDTIRVIIVSDGEGGGTDEEQRQGYSELRRQESRKAAYALEYGQPEFWGLPDRGIAYGEFLVQRIEQAITEGGFDLVYAPSVYEMHPDHRALGMSTIEAVRRSPEQPTLALYEVGIPMIRPSVLLDISDIMDQKQLAMASFTSQLKLQAYDQQIAALNRFRTYTLGTQVSAAEAYLVTSAQGLRNDFDGLFQSEYENQRRIGLPMIPSDIPLVSVLIRSMDRPTLRSALDSVALQTYPHIEVVIANALGTGHSTLSEWCGRFPMRSVGNGNRLQRSQAANFALKTARGDYLIFLDDDDWFEPHHISVLVEQIRLKPNYQAVYSNVQVIGAEGQYSGHIFNTEFDPIRLMADNLIPIHAILFSRKLVEVGCLFDETLDVYEDWDFWLQIARHTGFFHVDSVGAYYYAAGNSLVGLQGEDQAKAKARELVFAKWKNIWDGGQISALLAYKDSLVVSKNQELRNFEQTFEQALKSQTDGLNAKIHGLEAQLKEEQRRLLDQMAITDSIARGLAEFELKANEFQRQLEEVRASTSWMVSAPIRFVGVKARNLKYVATMAGRFIRANGGGSRGAAKLVTKILTTIRRHGLRGLLYKIKAFARHSDASVSFVPTVYPAATFDPITRYGVSPHEQTVEIIVCVHNALHDVRRCLESVLSHTLPPYSLVVVDDGSDQPTKEYLEDFCSAQGAKLIRNPVAKGYTLAANQGLRSTTADYVVLLNSDTIVSGQWIDRMIMCAESDARLGIVGPLSNTASWQSVPDILINGDWAENLLPDGMSINDMAALVAGRSARLYPRIPLLNGFCLLIKRALVKDIGFFDEESFARGYGEENDYCLRARNAGWSLAVADDVYVFHAQSKSYSHEKRKILSQHAGEMLAQKHGQPAIDASVTFCRYDRVLDGLRIGVRGALTSHATRSKAKSRWEGKRVLFFLPTADAGGGSNVVISEALALISFGIDARLANYTCNLSAFERSYPAIQVPRVYVANDAELSTVIHDYDAVVATVNTTVPTLVQALADLPAPPIVGYYVQDYEPWFYGEGSRDYKSALSSYSLIPNMVLFTKTEWNKQTVKEKTGMDCTVIGPSYNSTLFRPRPRKEASWPERALRIIAMIRPYTPRRAAKLTMEVLRAAEKKYGNRVDIVLFGEESDHPDFVALPGDFKWRNVGKQTTDQLALLLNESDIFVDFSEYQAMGLTAMEAMACGVAVVVPQLGGAGSFAKNGESALFVDSSDMNACLNAVSRLIEDDALRISLQQRALQDVAAFSPDIAAYRLMQTLFPTEDSIEGAPA